MIIPNNCNHTDLDRLEGQVLNSLRTAKLLSDIAYRAMRASAKAKFSAIDAHREQLLKIARAGR